MTKQFEDYPPEFDLSAPDLQRYGITKIWAAFHDPYLRPALFREWRSGYRSFPAWVGQKVYAQRRAKHTPSRRGGGVTRRPYWRDAYASELAASPALAGALGLEPSRRIGEAFRIAGLSGGESAVMRRLLEGDEPAEITKELQMSWGAYQANRSRAVAKLRRAFVVVPGLVQGRAIEP